MHPPAYNYCSQCAHALTVEVPPDDNRLRHVCHHCGAIHYRNPRLVVGVVCTWQDRLLLCRRAIEPRHGLWTLPAGFHEIGESTGDGALRETREEAGARVELDGLFSMIDVLGAEQVHLFYRGRMTGPELDPGPESLEAGLFDENDIPWDRIAFRTVEQTLRWFIEDRRRGRFELHQASLGVPPADYGPTPRAAG